jgi:hypothetical protein
MNVGCFLTRNAHVIVAILTLISNNIVAPYGIIHDGGEHTYGGHQNFHVDQWHLRRAQADVAYWEARDKAQLEREGLPEAAMSSETSDVGGVRRIWDFFAPDYNCPSLKERIGRIGDGGKWVCGMRRFSEGRQCLVYSLGSAGDTTFEEEFLNRTECEVHTFDPSLPPDTQDAVLGREGLIFHSVGIGGAQYRQLSSDAPESSSNVQSLQAVMEGLGHVWLDVLKIDIEGHEWGLLSEYYATPDANLPATQLLVEFHFPDNAAIVWQVFDMLLADNFRVFASEPNYYCGDGCCAKNLIEYAFIKVTPDGHVCVPRGHSTVGNRFSLQLPHGCMSAPAGETEKL